MTFRSYLVQPRITDDPRLAEDLWMATARCPAPAQQRRNCQDKRRARRQLADCESCKYWKHWMDAILAARGYRLIRRKPKRMK